MKLYFLIIGVSLGSIITASAQSSFTAELDPFQEVPPHNTPGYGSADLTLNGTTLSIAANAGTYGGLLGGATAVTLNDAAVGMNGGSIFSWTLDNPGTTSGTFEGSGTLTAGQITDLNAGNLYINIRDSVYPSGEIRGQIEVVPEPSVMALAGLGAMIFRAMRIRRA